MLFLLTAIILVGISYLIASDPERFYLRFLPILGTFFGKSIFVNFIMKFRKPVIDRFVMKWELAELVGNCTGKEFRESAMGDLDRLFFSELDYVMFLGKNNVHDLALDNDKELSARVKRFFEVFAILDNKLGITPEESITASVKRKYGPLISSLEMSGT